MRTQVHRIGFWVLMVLLAACNSSVKDPDDRPCQELAAVDSLMWVCPDSALTCLMACYDTVSDRHYANLLLAELLYKNDYEQTNRTELLAAVAYYDSVSDPFLTARAHYINGVGYYERDSVVPACEQYLKAVEIMEEHFTEKELVGQRAKFMALTYSHLCELFSDQYLHEQAIYFGKQSLPYYYRHHAEPWHIAWILEVIGSQYEMEENLDSAMSYYQKGFEVLIDTNAVSYRDLKTHMAYNSYKRCNDPLVSFNILYELLKQAESDKEKLSRCFIIGAIYYDETLYDSAFLYLNRVYEGTSSVGSKKQAAEWLAEICKAQGEDLKAYRYTDFLAPFATLEEKKSNIKSQFAELCNNHKQRQTEFVHQNRIRKQTRHTLFVVTGLGVVILCYFVLYRTNKRKKQHLEVQIKQEQYAHEIKQRALSGRLKQSNEALRIQKKRADDLTKEEYLQQRQIAWSDLEGFMQEGICLEIMTLLGNKTIKRESKKDDYPELRLSNAQLNNLSMAVEKHFRGFEETLTDLYPKISRNVINQCFLYLLNLEDVQIAALLSCDYTTIKRRSSKLKKVFKTEKEPRTYIRGLVS